MSLIVAQEVKGNANRTCQVGSEEQHSTCVELANIQEHQLCAVSPSMRVGLRSTGKRRHTCGSRLGSHPWGE